MCHIIQQVFINLLILKNHYYVCFSNINSKIVKLNGHHSTEHCQILICRVLSHTILQYKISMKYFQDKDNS